MGRHSNKMMYVSVDKADHVHELIVQANTMYTHAMVKKAAETVQLPHL